ncbi:MAG: ribonuclease III family protein [Candidatus Jordarchaeum sp.]|uniref:ribonuclease III family protein n=1 Tax=Candidatus Jordarchaeum sp. TaxID=2823881 RepID=UPI004049C65F
MSFSKDDKYNFNNLSPKPKSLKEILNDKNLAKLGDNIANLLYSLIKSKLIGKPDGAKIPDTILAEAIRKAGLRKHLSARQNADSLGDAAEALIAYSWLKDHFDIKETAEQLISLIPERNIVNRKTEKEISIKIFTLLLQNLLERIESENKQKVNNQLD